MSYEMMISIGISFLILGFGVWNLWFFAMKEYYQVIGEGEFIYRKNVPDFHFDCDIEHIQKRVFSTRKKIFYTRCYVEPTFADPNLDHIERRVITTSIYDRITGVKYTDPLAKWLRDAIEIHLRLRNWKKYA